MEENRPSKIEENTQETSKMEDNKTQEKAELADDKKTEDHHHSSLETEEKTKISPEEAKEKKNISPAKMAEDQTTEIDFEYYDEIDHVFNEFLAEKSLIEETDADQNRISVDELFQKIGASTVLVSYIEARESGNTDKLGHNLEPHQAFAGILVMLCVYYNHKYTKEEVYLVLKILKEHMIKSKCDVVGFTEKFGSKEIDLQEILQRAMWYVMCIFNLETEVDVPAKMITEAIINAYLSRIWDDGVFSTLSSFLRSEYTTLHRVAFVVVTVLAKLSKERNSEELSSMIHKAKIVDAMRKMDLTKLSEGVQKHARVCCEALGKMPNPTKSLSYLMAALAGKATTVLEKQAQ